MIKDKEKNNKQTQLTFGENFVYFCYFFLLALGLAYDYNALMISNLPSSGRSYLADCFVAHQMNFIFQIFFSLYIIDFVV